MMVERAALIFSLTVIAISSHGCAHRRAPERNEVIYKWEDGNLIDVFNLSTMWGSQEGIGYLSERNGNYGEFGGRFYFCSNSDFLCVIGGIAAVVPRSMDGQSEWSFENMQCRSNEPIGASVLNAISCTHRGQVTEFTYSAQQGIVSYQNKVGDPPWRKMRLYSEIGLLAPQGDNEALQIK